MHQYCNFNSFGSSIENLRNYNIPNWVIICALINPIRIILLSADVLTAFLTHGLFLSLVFITLFLVGLSYLFIY